jgi:predicted O-linked N-acetylglucosamine transferase (SPINDLY family)
MASILEAHAPECVESFVYSNGPVADATTDRLRRAAGAWRDVSAMTDEAVASLVRSDAIDVLVDLSGHSARNRLAVFGARAAPVQVSYLGYVATTGLASIDYVLTDADTAPPGSEGLFSEAVVRLPSGKFCYVPPAYASEPAPPPSARTGAVTFGSFNNVLKLGPEVIDLWSQVLAAAPGSRLVLKWPALAEPCVRDRIARAFEACGVEAGRLDLRGVSPHAAMLGEYGDIDVALDPFPHCGGLTTCEALWMGVPVVSLPQERPASRQSLAILNLIGLGELCARSTADYVEIAARLATDAPRRAALRSDLRRRMAASPLCDGAGFTRELEAAFRQMWRRWSAAS